MSREVSAARAAAITTLVCLAPVISHSIGRSLYGLLLTAMRDEFDLTNSQAGYPSSAIFACYVIGVLGVVFLSPRFEPIAILRAAVALSAGGLALTATAGGLLALTAGVAIVGGAGAGIWMTAPVLATEYVSEQRRGLVIGALTSTIGLSNISFGVGTRWWRTASDDPGLWRPIWWVAFGFTSMILVGLGTVATFARTRRIAARSNPTQILRSVPKWKQVTLAYALFGGMTAGFGTFIVAALEDLGGVDKATSPIVFSLMGVAGMVMAPAAGALSDRIGRLPTLRYALLVLVAANIAVVVGTTASTVLGALLYSAGAAAFPALIAAYVRDSLDNRAFSQALALMTVLFSLMAAATPAVVGRLADISFRWSFLLLAVLTTAGLGFMTMADRTTLQDS